MSSPVDFKPNAILICLPKTDDDFVGQTGTVTGWGRLSKNGETSNVLREVQLPIISNERCMWMHRSSGFNEWIPNTNLCAGTTEWVGTERGGGSPCVGDSFGSKIIQWKIHFSRNCQLELWMWRAQSSRSIYKN